MWIPNQVGNDKLAVGNDKLVVGNDRWGQTTFCKVAWSWQMRKALISSRPMKDCITA